MKDTEEKEVQIQPLTSSPACRVEKPGLDSPRLPSEYSHCSCTGKGGAAAWRRVTGKQGRAGGSLMGRRGPELCPPGDDLMLCCPRPAGWGKHCQCAWLSVPSQPSAGDWPGPPGLAQPLPDSQATEACGVTKAPQQSDVEERASHLQKWREECETSLCYS